MIKVFGGELVLPTHYCEDGVTEEESIVLSYIKQEVSRTGKPVSVNTLIIQFGSYHHFLRTKVWHCKPVESMIDSGVLLMAAPDTLPLPLPA